MPQPTIVIDQKIPYIKGVFEPYAHVHYLAPSQIDATTIQGCDILVTRTRTQCNAALLANSRCRFIATATIGYDHIDTAYCQAAGVEWCNAPGCNATSVAQYIASCLVLLQQRQGWSWGERTIGIVGVGHVGRAVEQVCRTLGLRVLLCDPPRAEREGSEGFVPLAEIAAQCDIVTFHTPLTREGAHPTYHLAGERFFEQLREGAVVINSSRGAVVSGRALLHAYTLGRVSEYLLDCWEGEPHLDPQLLEHAFVATPHIAGYSADGKCNATRMVIAAVAQRLGVTIDTHSTTPPPPPFAQIDLRGCEGDTLQAALLASYHPMSDMEQLVSCVERFEEIRGNYPLRREYSAYTLLLDGDDPHRATLAALGFTLL